MRLISLTPTTTLMLSLLLCLTFTTKTAHSAYTSISTAAQLKAFANEVNAGTTYSGSTVTLTNDIDMSGYSFTPIGVYAANEIKDFRGVFDGNGYSIKNLKYSGSSVNYAGLFGYSNGGTIKNVVVDSSCSISNSNSMTGYAAGIVGYVNAGASQANILNCVNMGTITGSGPYSKVAGIAGYLCGCTYTAIVMNCVNVGAIKYTGTATRSYVGGVVAWLGGASTVTPSVLNCVNLGTVTATHTIVGAIVGNSTFNSGTIKNCYWLSGTAPQCYKGDPTTASGNYAFDASYTLTTGNALVTTLNNYVTSQSTYSLQKWSTATFSVNGGSTVNPKLIMWVMLGTPDTPTKPEGTFRGWYTNPGLTTAWSSSTRYGSGEGATLYAKWKMNQYTVTFDSDGGSAVPSVTQDYGTSITLSTPTKEGHKFNGWKDASGSVYTTSYTIKGNAILTAQWTVNQYTVTFDVNGGEDLDEPSKTVTYGEKYGELPEPINLGHNFLGWFTSNVSGGGGLITSETTVDVDDNHTLYALWDVNNYTVTFDFDNGTEIDVFFVFDDEIIYPDDLTKEGHTFLGWDNNFTKMPADNIIFKALWIANNYTVTFDFGNGTVTEELFYYGEVITYPESPKREGYTFDGWNNTYDRMPAEDITIKAIWKVTPTEYVKIEFNKKDMSESEVKDIISKYIDSTDYEIRIVESENSGTTVIIKFSDVKEAKYFRDSIEASNEADKQFISRVDFISGWDADFSLPLNMPYLCYLFHLLI